MRSRRLALQLAAPLAWAASFVAPLAAAAGPPPPAPPPEAQATAYLEAMWRTTGNPGVSAAVAQGGRLVFSRGFGVADLDNLVPAMGTTVYNIGSVSKIIAAVAVMQLVEQGKVGLDDPIQKYVPSFPDKGAPITLRHILTHTSGIRHYRPSDFPGTGDNENMRPVSSLEEGIRIFKDDPLLFAPGAYYSYSSYAANLLQGVVETASGLPFEEYLRRHVWGPAGMLATQFDVPERVVPNRAKSYRIVEGRPLNSFYGDLTYKFAGGGMISTAEDLVRLGAALNRGGLLRPETLALMVRPHLDPVMRYVEGGAAEREEWKLGFMWRLLTDDAGRPFVFHSGSVKDFNAMLVNYPERDLVVALLTNAGQGRPRADALALAGFFLAAGEPATSP